MSLPVRFWCTTMAPQCWNTSTCLMKSTRPPNELWNQNLSANPLMDDRRYSTHPAATANAAPAGMVAGGRGGCLSTGVQTPSPSESMKRSVWPTY
jgi:hypothetical protein